METRPKLFLEYWFCVYHGKLTMGDLWRMTVADRRWWIGQTIDFIRQQNEAQEKSVNNRSSGTSQNPEAVKAAREMIQNYHKISAAEG